MSDSAIGNYAMPQNEHDRFLLKTFPHVPLSLMRDIWTIHSEMSEEQQADFLEASIKKNWGVYDEKYNIKDIKYDNVEEIKEYEKNEANEKIKEITE